MLCCTIVYMHDMHHRLATQSYESQWTVHMMHGRCTCTTQRATALLAVGVVVVLARPACKAGHGSTSTGTTNLPRAQLHAHSALQNAMPGYSFHGWVGFSFIYFLYMHDERVGRPRIFSGFFVGVIIFTKELNCAVSFRFYKLMNVYLYH